MQTHIEPTSQQPPQTHPIILCFSGHDPSGGAGIQADIETLASQGCHACSVITALTEQNSHNVKKLLPQPAEEIFRQANTLCADFKISAIKIGLIGHADTVTVIATLIDSYPDLPVVLDPVLAAGGGTPLASISLIQKIQSELLPKTIILTPNSQEARQLAGQSDLNDCAAQLLDFGCRSVLITGTHEQTDSVINTLYCPNSTPERFQWPRLPENYHGSGCTLASALTAHLAHGDDLVSACFKAQEYTWNALSHGFRPGTGQHHPDRLFWRTNP